jgi:hypothetical protein
MTWAPYVYNEAHSHARDESFTAYFPLMIDHSIPPQLSAY